MPFGVNPEQRESHKGNGKSPRCRPVRKPVAISELDARLREWKPETAAEARERITELIRLADGDILDVARSRTAEQEVLDLLDDAPTR